MSLIPFGFWAASGAGGGGAAYDLLETTTLATAASSVTFSGLGSYSDYAHLQIRFVARSTRVSTSSFVSMTLNDDTTSNYAVHTLLGTGTDVYSSADVSQNKVYRPVRITGASAATGAFGLAVIDLLGFSSSTKNKTLRMLGGNAGTSQIAITLASGLWADTDAVTSIEIFDDYGEDFVATSRFSLYGINGA